MEKWRMPVTPDILIVPSKLAYVAKEGAGCVVGNSNSLAKGNTGGSYACISVKPVARESLEDKDGDLMQEARAAERTAVEIKKI